MALGLVLVGLLAACGRSGLSGETAAEVLSAAETAAASAGGFHFVDKEGTGAQARVLVGDTGAQTAQEVESVGGSPQLSVELVHGTAYVRATAGTLESLFGLSSTEATAERGKWVSVTKGEPQYARIVSSLAPDAELDSYLPGTPLALGAASRLRGAPVLPVSGTPPAADYSSSILKAVVTLFVSTRSPYRPVGGVVSGTDVHGRHQSEEVAFSRWGERPQLRAPAGAVPLASLHG